MNQTVVKFPFEYKPTPVLTKEEQVGAVLEESDDSPLIYVNGVLMRQGENFKEVPGDVVQIVRVSKDGTQSFWKRLV